MRSSHGFGFPDTAREVESRQTPAAVEDAPLAQLVERQPAPQGVAVGGPTFDPSGVRHADESPLSWTQEKNMTMINCNREQYRQALAERAPTNAELRELQKAAQGLFNNVAFGRRINPTTWLMVLRAHTRGNVAISSLRQKYRWTARGLRAALDAQGAVLRALMVACPAYFAGMLVPSDEDAPTTAAHPTAPPAG